MFRNKRSYSTKYYSSIISIRSKDYVFRANPPLSPNHAPFRTRQERNGGQRWAHFYPGLDELAFTSPRRI